MAARSEHASQYDAPRQKRPLFQTVAATFFSAFLSGSATTIPEPHSHDIVRAYDYGTVRINPQTCEVIFEQNTENQESTSISDLLPLLQGQHDELMRHADFLENLARQRRWESRERERSIVYQNYINPDEINEHIRQLNQTAHSLRNLAQVNRTIMGDVLELISSREVIGDDIQNIPHFQDRLAELNEQLRLLGIGVVQNLHRSECLQEEGSHLGDSQSS